jgi:hypothetical protein
MSRKQTHPSVVFKVTLLDPFGVTLGEGMVSINDETWYRDLPEDVRQAQVQAMTNGRYGHVLQHPPFQIEVSRL